MNGDVGHSEPEPPSLPRKVVMERGPEGYGFNLHGEKGIHGQFISAVDEGSPAELNGVQVDDRVIAVNDSDVEDLPHSHVVEKIRDGGRKVSLLLVDEECDRFYKNLGIKIPQDKFEMAGEKNTVPEPADIVEDKVVTNGGEEVQEQNGEVTDSGYNADATETGQEGTVQEAEEDKEDENEYEEVIPKSAPNESAANPVEISTTTTTTIPNEVPTNGQQPDTTPSLDTTDSPDTTTKVESSSQLDMEAARPRPRRNDVKRATQNWKQKYEDFNKL